MRLIFPLFVLVCFHPAISSATALVLGLAFGLVFTHPYPDFNKRWVHRFLAWSIVGIGAGINLQILAQVGLSGITYTFCGILLTMLLGNLLGKWLKIPNELSLLVTAGTAICGGSAIAAVSATLRSKVENVSTSLIIVFLLNSVALILFPPIGHHFGLDESQFGLWAALAIHDTSSVVGASMHYGPHALEIGTTVKLARALWIVPLAFAIGWFVRRQSTDASAESSGARQAFKKSWFILGFIASAALTTWIPILQPPGHFIAEVAKRLFVVTLFIIGSGFNRKNLAALSPRPLIQAVALWVIAASASLTAITQGWITPP